LKLLIISHMPHYVQNGKVVGWGPTATEIDILAQVFDEICHIACLHPGPAPASSLPYSSDRIRFIGVPPSGGEKFEYKLDILRKIPIYTRKIGEELKKADIVHVRCPANISMLAIILLAFKRRPCYRWVKYAGNWQPGDQKIWSYTFQRWWLSKNFHRGVVSVNGHWPNQPHHIFTFHNPSLTIEEISIGRIIGDSKNIEVPIQLLYVGVVNKSKGIQRVLNIVSELHKRNIPFKLNVIGDGPSRVTCENWTIKNHLSGCVHFLGWQPKLVLSNYYARAHILLHPTDSDGWPKVISEAMAYGVVPIAGAVSSIPQILSDTSAGQAFHPDDTAAFIDAITKFVSDPSLWKRASQAGLNSANNFSYANYLCAINEMFIKSWGISLMLPKAINCIEKI
jgi:glycosyltransferase involved in cell wall biosynthesis